MKLEALVYSIASMGTALLAESHLPPEQALFVWSIAGTVCGAGIAAIHMPPDTRIIDRFWRAILSLLVGLVIAPYVIHALPRPLGTPDWWHAFGASGIGSALAYVVLAEAPSLLRSWLARFLNAKD